MFGQHRQHWILDININSFRAVNAALSVTNILCLITMSDESDKPLIESEDAKTEPGMRSKESTNLTESITIVPIPSINPHRRCAHKVGSRRTKSKTNRLIDQSFSKGRQKLQKKWCHKRILEVMRIRGEVGPHIDVYEWVWRDVVVA